MQFVDDEVVDSGRLERDAGVARLIQPRLDLVLFLQQSALESLDADPLLLGRLRRGGSQIGHALLDVGGFGLLVDRDLGERPLSQDDGIPVVGGSAGDEQASFVPRQFAGARGQDSRARVELEPLSRDLFEHVVRNDDEGLVHQAHAAHLHRAHHHDRPLPCPDFVKQSHRGLSDHARDGGPLTRSGSEVRGEAGEGQVVACVGVVAQNEGVEPQVVFVHKPLSPRRVLPDPLAEPLLQHFGLLLGGGRLVGVENPTLLSSGPSTSSYTRTVRCSMRA